MIKMKCQIGPCQNEASVLCKWGLFEINAKIKEKYKKKKKDSEFYDCTGVALEDMYEEGWTPRQEPMNEARLCSGCSDSLYDSIRGAINSGAMYWVNLKLDAN